MKQIPFWLRGDNNSIFFLREIADNVVEGLPLANWRELGRVAYQDKAGRMAAGDFRKKRRGYHRGLVDDDRLALQGTAGESVAHPAQHAVDGGGFEARGLLDACGGFAREGGEKHGVAFGLQAGGEFLDDGGLSRPRAARDDGEAAGGRLVDGGELVVV